MQARVDAIFNRWSGSTPGCAVAGAVNGRPVVRSAYGMADLEHDVPIAVNTIFEAGSVSKQFHRRGRAAAREGRQTWRDDHTRIVKRRAIAYRQRQITFAIDMPFENVHGNGGLLTTVDDLLKWNENFTTPMVGDAALRSGRACRGAQHEPGSGVGSPVRPPARRS